MPRRAKTRKPRKSGGDTLNVTGSGQYGQLAKLLGKNPVVLVFVYADWCGHCQHFKPDWKKLESAPHRNMAMVSVRDDALANSPLNNLVTPEGYPTVAVVSPQNDVSMNLPTRDPEILENIVTNADSLAPATASAETLNTNIQNIITNNIPAVNNTRITLTAASPRLQLNSNENESEINLKKTHSNVVPVTRDTINPPLSEQDVLSASSERSQGTDEGVLSANERLSNKPVNLRQLGGGLWSMLAGSGASASASASALTVAVKGGRRRPHKTRRRRYR